MKPINFKSREKKVVRVIQWIMAVLSTLFFIYFYKLLLSSEFITFTILHAMTFTELLAVVLSLISLVTNKPYYPFSKILSFITAFLWFSVFAVLYGSETAFNLLAITAIIATFLLFDSREFIQRTVFSILFLAVWLTAEINSLFFLEYIHKKVFSSSTYVLYRYNNYYYIVNLAAAIFSIFAILMVFVKNTLTLEKQLIESNRKVDQILRNVFPSVIVDKMYEKKEADTLSFTHPEAAVLFADITNFTPAIKNIEPEKLLAELNTIYNHFDKLAEKHSVEKIKTIGDGYMAACGVPEDTQDNAGNIINFALEMIDFIESYREQSIISDLNIRIGIDIGQVISGVIGNKRQIYDLWGNTVNSASRLESSGGTGRIHISKSVKDNLNETYNYEEHKVHLKGIGETTAYFLNGRIKQ